MTKEEIGAILKALRAKSGKTQKEVAELMGRKQQIIGHWETGYSQPDANSLFILCDIYNASVDVAFGFDRKYCHPVSIDESVSSDFTDSEITLIYSYRSLNEEGQEKLSSYADDLTETGKYKKLDKLCMGFEETSKQA